MTTFDKEMRRIESVIITCFTIETFHVGYDERDSKK